jgi:hypothetical protein
MIGEPKGSVMPPFALIDSDAFSDAVCMVVAFIVADSNPPITFRVCPVGIVKPPLAVISPEIFAEPTTSREAEGDELPIPIRPLEPPTI